MKSLFTFWAIFLFSVPALGAGNLAELMAKIHKLETATFGYYARTNYTPPAEADGMLDPDKTYYSKGTLTEADLRYDGAMLRPYRCNSDLSINVTGDYYCAQVELPLSVACELEIKLDDSSYSTGNGRLTGFTHPVKCGTESTPVLYRYRLELYGPPLDNIGHRLNIFEAAVATYYARTNNLPPLNAQGNIDTDIMIERELIKEKDLSLYIYELILIPCDSTNYVNVCLDMPRIPLSVACQAEVFKDDESYQRGEGRTYGEYANIPFNSPCDEQFGTVSYRYRVF